MLYLKDFFDASDCLVCSVLCKVLCARSYAQELCACLVRIPNVCEPQTSCVRCGADVARVLCGVFDGDSLWVWDMFFNNLVCSCAGVLGGTIPHKTPHNTLYLDKVLFASCEPGAFAKKSLGRPSAAIV